MLTEIKQYFERRKLEADLGKSCIRFAFEMFGDSLPRADAMLTIFNQRIEAAEKFNGYAKIKPIDVAAYRKIYNRCAFEIDEYEYCGYFNRNEPKPAEPTKSIDGLLQ